MTRGAPTEPETVEIENTDPHYSTGIDLRTIGDAIARISNDSDQDVTFTIQTAVGSDRAFAHPCESGSQILADALVGGIVVSGFSPSLVSSVTIGAGETTFAAVGGPWSRVRIKAVAGAAPGPGSSFTVELATKHRGD